MPATGGGSGTPLTRWHPGPRVSARSPDRCGTGPGELPATVGCNQAPLRWHPSPMIGDRYRRILAIRDARQPVLGTAIDRIPIAAISLATILLVRGETGSFAIAGFVAAAFAIANAVSLPIQGRLVDRLGQTRVLSVALVLNPIAL